MKMAQYSYKRVREQMPPHIERKYRDMSDNPKDWYWGNEYYGDLFDGAADYIEELKAALIAASRYLPKCGHDEVKHKIAQALNVGSNADVTGLAPGKDEQ
jgi:hypothetical protein